ncbi:hypothetical protein FRB93_011781 [Tulasnella sp. JGI-2019a]|nr:hypothetical protein FRB93_011781 [Tulasnella sp. JGI-2019a]
MRITIPTIPLPTLSAAAKPRFYNAVDYQVAAEKLAAFLHPKNTLVLTGAGVSVDSGIRAYRGSDGHYSNPNYKPVLFQELVSTGSKGHAFRQRYWSRSYLGYPPVRDAQPNPTHFAIAALQYLGHAPKLVTQNVDGLHHKASIFTPEETRRKILQLHGTLHMVHCGKRHAVDRMHFQDLLSRHNPAWKAFADDMELTGNKPRTNPDGDVDIEGIKFDNFVVPDCEACLAEGVRNNVVKPDVVFFGESIPDEVREGSFTMVQECDRLLVVGTTLATFSAFRLVKMALEQRKPVMIVNLGPTRADEFPVEKVDMPSREVLVRACKLLGGVRASQDETLSRLLSSGVIQPPDIDDDDRSPRAAG